MSNVVNLFGGNKNGGEDDQDLRLETYVASKFIAFNTDGQKELADFEEWAKSHGYTGLFFTYLKEQIDGFVQKMNELLLTHEQSGVAGTWPLAFEYYEEGWPWPIIKICTRWRKPGTDSDDPLAIVVVFTLYTMNGTVNTADGITKGSTAGELKVMGVHPDRFPTTQALEAFLAPLRALSDDGCTASHHLGFSEARYFSDYQQHWAKVVVPENIAEINFIYDIGVTIPAQVAIMDVEQQQKQE